MFGSVLVICLKNESDLYKIGCLSDINNPLGLYYFHGGMSSFELYNISGSEEYSEVTTTFCFVMVVESIALEKVTEISS